MVHDMKVNGSEFIKTVEITKRYDKHHRRPVHDAITRHHPPIPAPSWVGVLQARHHMHYLEQHLKSKAEYTNAHYGLPA
jgi:hypothetical protein